MEPTTAGVNIAGGGAYPAQETLTVTNSAPIGDLNLKLTGTWTIGEAGNAPLTNTFDVLFKVVTIVNPDDLSLEITP